MIEELLALCPPEIDLTNDRHSEIIDEIVASLLGANYSLSEIASIEDELLNTDDDSQIFVLLALKIVKSKIFASLVKGPLHISVVFAIYKEHNRIRRSSEHPHGEDFLTKKVKQLEWLFKDQQNITWELIIVDDGCPEGSGKIALQMIDTEGLAEKARVLFLSQAIAKSLPPAHSLSSTDQSQKGGSIVYGMWDAIQEKKSGEHVVVFTDADLSTHLGQTMLLVNPLLSQEKYAAIGSRRESKSVVIKKGTRNNRGKLFIYLWKRLIPNLKDIVDTQCGFKAFKAEIVAQIIDDLIEKKFAFDIELLVKTELLKRDSVTKVPIAWIDSEQASTTTDIQPYLPMLQSIVKMGKKYFPDDGANEFADFIASLDDEAFHKILQRIPENIVKRQPSEFGTYDRVRVRDFSH